MLPFFPSGPASCGPRDPVETFRRTLSCSAPQADNPAHLAEAIVLIPALCMKAMIGVGLQELRGGHVGPSCWHCWPWHITAG